MVNLQYNLSIILTVLLVGQGLGFTSNRLSTTSRRSKVVLDAWTLPTPTENLFGTSKMAHPWYDDHHPTKRTIIYTDDNNEERFQYVALANDWPSEKQEASQPRKARLRGALSWVRSKLSRVASS